jgi:putative peptidoglycan lipid II flippase
MLTSLSLGVLGVAATQINTAIDAVFARYACLEGPAYLNYAIHLQQLPLALFGVGVASVLLPSLSRAFQAGDQNLQLVEFVIGKAMLALIPCTAAIFVLGGASVNLIYGRGHFDLEALLQTTKCLWGYGIGLIPMALTLLLAPIFYARKDYKTPTVCSLIALGVNFVLNAIFVYWAQLGPASLACSTSIAAGVNAWLLSRKIQFSSALKYSLLTTTVCTLFAAGVSYTALSPTWTTVFSEQLFQFLALFGSFTVSFLAAALVIKKKEIFAFLGEKR